MNTVKAILCEIKMDLVSTARYKLGFVSDIITFFIFLCFLMLANTGASFSDAYNYADYKSLFLYGYVAWMLASAAISSATNDVHNELQRGTFYLKMKSKVSFISLLIGKLIASIIIQLLIVIIIVLFSVIIWKIKLFFNIMILSSLIISTFGMFGLGLLVAGITLLHKRIGAITFIIQLSLLFITDTLPTSSILTKITQVIPLTSCNAVIRQELSGIVQSNSFIILIITSVFWIIAGCISFKLFIIRAKKNGNLLMY